MAWFVQLPGIKALLPLPHFRIRSHLELQLNSEIQSGCGIAVAEVARNGLIFTLSRKKTTAGILLGF